MLKLAKKMGSNSHIIPVIVGENDRAIKLCNILYRNGYFTLPIRPPTVPIGTSRLRLSLNTSIETEDLNALFKILKI